MTTDVRRLGGTDVVALGSADVGLAREAARQGRLRWIATGVVACAAWLGYRFVTGRPIGLDGPELSPVMVQMLPALVMVVLLGSVVLLPMLAMGRSPHVLFRPGDIEVGLDDVKGADGVRDEVVKTLNLFLVHRQFSDRMGGNRRRGILFEGPPGTGKTYMAKAMAREAGVPFLFVSSSAFQSMYYGQTSRKLRSYFKALRKQARSQGGAIGFIEELDAIGASRSGMGGNGGREGQSGVVNELLIQLQSFDTPTLRSRVVAALIGGVNLWLPATRRLSVPRVTPANVLIVGATNRVDDLDPALTRPGRFDRSIYFDLPSRAGRREILDFYLGRKSHVADLDTEARRDALAAITIGYSPVMLEHLLDEALVWALRRGEDRLSWDDICRAKLTEEVGIAHPVTYTEAEQRTIATHESGHATVAWLVGKGRRLEVLSIIKRRDALGILAHSDSEERFTRTRGELEALVDIALGGLVAEQIFFGDTTSGPASDLAAATTWAAQMVGAFGMAGSLMSYEAIQTAAAGNLAAKVLGDDAGRAAVERILEGSRARVTRLIETHRHVVEALRDALLDRHELIGDEILSVIASAGPAETLEPHLDLT